MFGLGKKKGNIRVVAPSSGAEDAQQKEDVICAYEEEILQMIGRIKRTLQLYDALISRGKKLCASSKVLADQLSKYKSDTPSGKIMLQAFSNFCLIQQDAEQGMYLAVESQYIVPSKILLEYLDRRLPLKKALESARKQYVFYFLIFYFFFNFNFNFNF